MQTLFSGPLPRQEGEGPRVGAKEENPPTAKLIAPLPETISSSRETEEPEPLLSKTPFAGTVMLTRTLLVQAVCVACLTGPWLIEHEMRQRKKMVE